VVPVDSNDSDVRVSVTTAADVKTLTAPLPEALVIEDSDSDVGAVSSSATGTGIVRVPLAVDDTICLY
jgi:hypothetical protein